MNIKSGLAWTSGLDCLFFSSGLTGILLDSAMKLVIDCIPEATAQERRDALTRASKEALSKGITAVVDFGRFFPGSPTTKVWDDFHGSFCKG